MMTTLAFNELIMITVIASSYKTQLRQVSNVIITYGKIFLEIDLSILAVVWIVFYGTLEVKLFLYD